MSPVLGRVRIFELAFGFGMILGPSSLVPIGSRSGIIMITSPRLLALLSVYWWLKIYYLFISRLFFPPPPPPFCQLHSSKVKYQQVFCTFTINDKKKNLASFKSITPGPCHLS